MHIGDRLKKRMEELDWSEGEVSRRSGVSQPTIHRIICGESREPRQSNVDRIAKAMGVTSDYLRYGDTVQEASGLHTTQPTESLRKIPIPTGRVPLISWAQAATIEKNDIVSMLPSDAEKWMDCPFPHSVDAYCLRIDGDNMMPEYRDGEIILVDPAVIAKHGDDVVVRTPKNRATFKRLQRTTDGTYLLTLNPLYPTRVTLVPDDIHICGVVIGSWISRLKK